MMSEEENKFVIIPIKKKTKKKLCKLLVRDDFASFNELLKYLIDKNN